MAAAQQHRDLLDLHLIQYPGRERPLGRVRAVHEDEDRDTVVIATPVIHELGGPPAGTTTTDLWPPTARPVATIEVTNTDEWFIAIAAGHALGASTSATPSNYTHPSLVYRPLADGSN